MTILAMTDAAGGLEVRMADGAWAAVVARPNELVVNLGDMMARWTNGRWASTVHRVANPPVVNLAESRRQSIGYFMHPDYDAPIRCIPTCVEAGTPPRFPEITAGMHIRNKIAQSHNTA
jgi:isopenicillin N synthase-like dioxygenase